MMKLARYMGLRRLLLQSAVFGVAFTTVLFGVGGLAGLGKVFAASDCDSNAVIYCGVSSVGDVQAKYAGGDGRNSGASIRHIFSGFGISSSDIEAMNSTAKNGSISRNGNVYFGDKLVATGAVTAGRQDMPGSTKHTNQGTTYYSRPPSVSFASSPLDAYVMMKDGVFQYAIIKSCGNPVKAEAKTPPPTPAPAPKPTPPPPPAPAPPPKPTPPAAAQPAPDVCSGNTTNSNTNGIASQGGNCSINTTTVVIQQAPPAPPPPPPDTSVPSGQCISLTVTAAAGDSTAMTVNAAVSYSAQHGATLRDITYVFGDGISLPPTTATTTTHTYQQAGSYTITATVAFNNPTGSAATAIPDSVCQASISVSPAPTPVTPPPPAPPETPTVTQASSPTPAPAQTTTAPVSLVKTGPGSLAALFGITTIVSTLAYRYFLQRRLGSQ